MVFRSPELMQKPSTAAEASVDPSTPTGRWEAEEGESPVSLVYAVTNKMGGKNWHSRLFFDLYTHEVVPMHLHEHVSIRMHIHYIQAYTDRPWKDFKIYNTDFTGLLPIPSRQPTQSVFGVFALLNEFLHKLYESLDWILFFKMTRSHSLPSHMTERKCLNLSLFLWGYHGRDVTFIAYLMLTTS